jgi:hypothetical protein
MFERNFISGSHTGRRPARLSLGLLLVRRRVEAHSRREGRRRAQQSQKTHDDDEKFHLIFFLFFSLSCVSLAKFFRIVLFCFVLFFSLPRDSRVFFFSSSQSQG